MTRSATAPATYRVTCADDTVHTFSLTFRQRAGMRALATERAITGSREITGYTGLAVAPATVAVLERAKLVRRTGPNALELTVMGDAFGTILRGHSGNLMRGEWIEATHDDQRFRVHEAV